MSFGMRKRLVWWQINQLPKEKIDKARRLYLVLDKIEWLTLSPILMGTIIPLLPVLAIFSYFGYRNPSILFLILIFILCWIMGWIGLRLLFNPIRKRKIDELQVMLSSNTQFSEMLETLKEIDPDMARNIRNHIP